MSHLLKEYKLVGTEQRIVINYSTEYSSHSKSAIPGLVKSGPVAVEAYLGILRQTILPDNEVNTITFEITLTHDHPHSRLWYIGDIPIPNTTMMLPEGSINQQVRDIKIRDLIASNLLIDITSQVVDIAMRERED